MKLKDRRQYLITEVLKLIGEGKEHLAQDRLLYGQREDVKDFDGNLVESAWEMPGYKSDWTDALQAFNLRRAKDGEQDVDAAQRTVLLRTTLLTWVVDAIRAM